MFEHKQFNNFKNIKTNLELSQDNLFEFGNIFDNLHGKIIRGEVRNFNRGEYNRYYTNRDNVIEFKQKTSIILYWNAKPAFYFHKSNELIYIPKTLAKRILDNFDTITHNNKLHILRSNLVNIFGWESKYLNDNWSTLTIIM